MQPITNPHQQTYVDPSQQIYYPEEDEFSPPFLDDPFLTEIAIQNMFSVDASDSSIDPFQSDLYEKKSTPPLKRSLLQNLSTQPSKRKKTTAEIKETANQEKDNIIPQGNIDTTTIPTDLLFHTEQTTNNLVTRMTDEIKSTQIKNNYVVPSSHAGYYQNVFERESEELYEAALQLDLLEAQAVLGGNQGTTQWIRKGFYNGQEIYKGLIYVDGTCSLYLLPTNQNLVSFFNQNSSIPHLEAIRKVKISKIQSECNIYFSSIRYYQDIFRLESEGSLEMACQMDSSEAQAILGTTQGKTWWIRKSFHNGQETYKGIVYENGKCSHCMFSTNDHLIYFFNQNSSIPHLEALRQEKISKIQSECSAYFSSIRYYQDIFRLESEGSLEMAYQMDSSEAQAILGATQGKTWWIRKGFHNGQETYKGIVYENEKCSYYMASTNNDLIYFFRQNSSISHLEALRNEKISKIQSEWSVYFSSIRYYQDVFRLESEGSLEMAYQMDSSEAQAILGATQGKTWWVRKGFHNGQETYKSIVYENGKCSHCMSPTNDHLIYFFNQNSSIPHLEALRQEKISKIQSEWSAYFSSIRYYQDVFRLESEGSLEMAYQMDSSEAQAILGTTQGKTWWIRKSFHNGQETYKGIVYENGKCSYYIASTNNDLIYFFKQNSSISHLEALRKEKISKIQNECGIYFSSIRYYQDVFRLESEGSLEMAYQMDSSEVQAILGTTQGKTWWIRKGFYNVQEAYKGIVYENGKCSHCMFSTNDHLIYFFNQNSSIPHLEALRQEKISKIQSECSVYFSSIRYYQDVFRLESEGSLEMAYQMDSSEAQAILGTTQGKTWWIRKSFHNGQETYKGIVYENGKCSYYMASSNNDLIYFFNHNSSIPHLEALRRGKISKIQNEYMIRPSSDEYYQIVLHEEYKEMSHKALQLDCLEAQIVLGQTQGKTWWIRNGSYNGQVIQKGVVYSNGECFYSPLHTDQALLSFYNQNSSIPHLEAIRKKKINIIQNDCAAYFSSIKYYQDALSKEFSNCASCQ